MPNIRTGPGGTTIPKVTLPLQGGKQPAKKSAGSDIVTTTAFELIAVGLMALLAGVSDDVGKVVVVVMTGFLIGWLIINAPTLAGWIKNA